MHFTLISPRLAIQKGDFLGSGVPYWPVELATLAAHIRNSGDAVALIDQFGENPGHVEDAGDHYLQGVAIDEDLWTDRLARAEAFVLFAISYMSHGDLLSTVRRLRTSFPDRPIAILENAQAVTAYALNRVQQAYFDAGADLLICGDPYSNWSEIRAWLATDRNELDSKTVPDNAIAVSSPRPPRRLAGKSQRYPVPAWDLVNLENYWRLPYSHGPKSPRFLPVLTSRGCPYPCDFCVVPETNNRRWNGNDPEDVVAEMIELRDRFGAHDFQVEDLNPTVSHDRWEKICELLIERQANVRFYLVSGTKAETVHIDKVPLLAEAGCRYISISPESGSEALMRIVGKRFNQRHGLELVAACRKAGIRTQACFLVGHPDETSRDIELSRDYLARLARAGLDEVAVFVVAPFAGSALHERNAISVDRQNLLPTFSPRGRAEYSTLAKRRRALILTFFRTKLTSSLDLWKQGLRALFGTPQTKMENLPYRFLYVSWLVARRNWIR